MATERGVLPQKAFYKLGEVCELTDTQPYVLRFWESEFPQIAPGKNRSGQRVYRREDIELILKIKRLLNEEEYTIAEARRRIEDEARHDGQSPVARGAAPSASGSSRPEPRSRGRLPLRQSSEDPKRAAGRDEENDRVPPPAEGEAVARLESALAASEADRNASRARVREALDKLDTVVRRLENERSRG